uniref:Cuticle protein 6 n=2 Tax=Timema TaxID=61471 RepID=A0A7R9HB11_TIMCR|nr:unnamed protein product [Timema cristinae]
MSVVSPILLGPLVTVLNLLWEGGVCVKEGGVYLNTRWERAASEREVKIAFSCVLALAAATPGYLGSPLAASYAGPYAAGPYASGIYGAGIYGATPYAAAPLAAAVPHAASVSTQYHAQDELGQYSYGYSGGPSAKQETRTLDGVTRGGYSYIDAHGLVQSASYVSDPINGFRVAATNLPVGPSAPAPVHALPSVAVHSAGLAAPVITPSLVDPVAIAAGAPLPVGDTPEVIAAKIDHYNAHVEAKANLLGRKKRSPGYLHGGAAALAAPALVAGPAHSFGYSSVSAHASPLAVAGPVISSYAAPGISAYATHGPARSFAYNTVAAAPLAAPAVATYAAHAPTVVATPARSFGYSTVSAHASPLAVAGPVISSYAAPGISSYATHGPARSFAYNTVAAAPLAAPAVATYAAHAPTVVATPARSFGYSTVSAHASPLAVAGPVISSYAAPGISSYATHGPARSFAYNTVAAAPLAAPAVAAYAAGPVAVAHAAPAIATYATPVAAVGSSQYQAQDELGQYSYGYADGNSVKHESRAIDGTTHGAYSYVDGNGIVQSVKYHADALGFRAHGTNFPVA